MFKQKETFASLMKSIKTTAGEDEINLIGFSGGYRAIAEILKQPTRGNITSVTMLDGTFPDSSHNIEAELIKFSQTGKVTMYTGSQLARTAATAQNILKRGNSENIKYVHDTSSHGAIGDKFLLSGMLAAAGVTNNVDMYANNKLGNFFINLANNWATKNRIATDQIKGHCEQFCNNFIADVLRQFGKIKKATGNFNAPISENATANLRGTKIADLTRQEITANLQPGQVIFCNNSDKYIGENTVIRGTTKKLPKIAAKRHWFVYNGIDKNGEPRFSDNHKQNQTLSEIKQRIGGSNRVVINVHDPLAEYRGTINNRLIALKTDTSNQERVPILAGGPGAQAVPPSSPTIAPTAPQPAPAPAVTRPKAESTEKPIDTNLQQNIEKIVKNMRGNVAVSIYDPDTNRYLAQINKTSEASAASLIKVPILFALHKAVKLGKVATKDVRQLQKYAEKMITVSDNPATDAIINYLGIDFIKQTLRELGLSDTKFGSLMSDKTLRTNFITAQDMTKILSLAIKAEPPAGWVSTMDLMEKNGHTGVLGAMIPQDVKIARKCGANSEAEHYSAVYTLGNKRLVMVVMVSKFGTRGKAKEGIREIGMLAYNALKTKSGD